MQASECGYNTQYPRTPGGITDPEYSISVGIQNLADCLQTAGAESPIDLDHIQLALQGYNFGSGYITWALRKYGEYSRANAIEFSLKMAEQMGWNSYGDKQYVPHVLRYYPIGKVFYTPEDGDAIVDVALSQVGNVGGEPYWSWYGFSNHVEWCACFVSWCADQCGYLDSGTCPKFSGCVFGMQWFQQRGLWLDGSRTSPGNAHLLRLGHPGRCAGPCGNCGKGGKRDCLHRGGKFQRYVPTEAICAGERSDFGVWDGGRLKNLMSRLSSLLACHFIAQPHQFLDLIFWYCIIQ